MKYFFIEPNLTIPEHGYYVNILSVF